MQTTQTAETKLKRTPLEVAQSIFARKGARELASAYLDLATRKLAGGLSIEDLPDLACGMDFRDDWQSRFEAEGVTLENTRECLAQAKECVREILAEDGFDFEGGDE
jgi:hypothetical protein